MPLLFLSLFSSILGLSILFPILGPLGRALGLTESEIGLTTTSYALAQFVAAPFWGRRSERVGRKPTLLIGVVGFGVAFVALGIVAELGARGVLRGTPLLFALIAARLAGGLLSSATIPTAQAWAADLTDRANRTSGMAVIGASFGLALIFGPVIGGVVSHFFGLFAPIWVSVLIAIVNALLVTSRLREPEKRQSTTRTSFRGIIGRARTLLAIGFLTTFASVLMEQTIAFAFQDRLHLTTEDTPYYVGAALGLYGVIAVFAQGFVVRRFKIAPGTLMMIGLPLTTTGMALLAFAHDFVSLATAMAVQGLGQGLVMPGVTAALSLGASDDEQGDVAGANSSAQGLGRLVGPLVGPSLYQIAQPLPFEASAALLATLLVFVIFTPSVRSIGRA
jgi:MFS family permease